MKGPNKYIFKLKLKLKIIQNDYFYQDNITVGLNKLYFSIELHFVHKCFDNTTLFIKCVTFWIENESV